jgi:predicted ribosomally synthesized peptide with SipW-like signal peptide
MKKILGLMVAALLVIMMVGGGTWAYFSDTESSANNSLAAGTLDLNINGDNEAVTTFSVDNKAPGDSGNGSSTLTNVGSLDGELDIVFSEVTNTGGSGGTQFEDGVGDLGGKAEMAVFVDVDSDEAWSDGDIGLKSDGSKYNHPTALSYATINSYSEQSWDAIETLAAEASDKIVIMWQIPGETTGNEIQGDSISLDITFTLEQAEAD